MRSKAGQQRSDVPTRTVRQGEHRQLWVAQRSLERLQYFLITSMRNNGFDGLAGSVITLAPAGRLATSHGSARTAPKQSVGLTTLACTAD